MFKLWFYAKNIVSTTNDYDYVYPEKDLVMYNITLDNLNYPTNDLEGIWVSYVDLAYN